VTEPILDMVDVSRTHVRGSVEVRALAGVSLSVAAGELVAVMGPSGSGKSSLLDLAGGLDAPTSGRVFVCGEPLDRLRPSALAALRRSTIGYVFQELNLIGGLTARENVSLPLELDGVSARQASLKAVRAMELVGLTNTANQFPDSLSGGEQQRVAIARALVGTRRLILADEPTGALDSATGEAIVTLLRERCDGGMAAVLVTHEPRYAAWADRVVFLRDGAVVEPTEAGV
jgi:putative ABC transport system ATP-binding protein